MPIERIDMLELAFGAGYDGAMFQGFVDETVGAKYNTLNFDGFTQPERLELGLTFTQLEKKYGIRPMANVYGRKQEAVPFSERGKRLSQGSIPQMKVSDTWDEDRYRDYMIDAKVYGASDPYVKSTSLTGLFDVCEGLVGSQYNALSHQRDQIVSTGKLVLTSTNNPYGINASFDMNIPSGNIIQLSGEKRWWKSVSSGVYSSEGSSCDPVKDMKKIVSDAKAKGIIGHFEVQDTFMEQILDHSGIKTILAGKFFPVADSSSAQSYLRSVPDEDKIEELGKIVGARIVVRPGISCVEYIDNGAIAERTFKSFNDNVLSFVPDGKIGTVVASTPILAPGGMYATMFNGALAISVNIDSKRKTQDFESELTAICVLESPSKVYLLKPYGNS